MPFDLLCCIRPGVEEVLELDYSHQSLSDVPPDVFVYERTLETLLCQSNRIIELPRQLFMCHGLKYLDISDNELQALPMAISSLVNLRHLNVSKNAISSLPDTMKSLKHLVFLDLSLNPLEKLPEAITNLITLNELYLNDTYLEYLPGNFGRLVNLKILELRDNYLMILPKSLARSTELLRLDIGQNEFQQFPEVIGKFSKLKELWMDCNSLINIPAAVKSLICLIHFEASNNMIEEIAPEISYCSELIDVSFSSNNLTQLPDTIGNLAKVVTFKLDHNKLYSLPESLGQLKSLEELMLMSNYLDRLPSSIGSLRKLQYLNVDENLLRFVPPEIGSCTKLSVLSLRSNKLSSIPPEVGHLSSLRVLNLVRNSLSNLPQSLLNCDNLVALWLSENQSKPLVPMQSEIDPKTYHQVLTCFLFPQVPLSPVESKSNENRPEDVNAQVQPRHISFMDMKAVAKTIEKPGQLRRAPTPYPKELRALAKHARNVQKDGTHDISPPMQNAVHIKAAKITPTLQQRFADEHQPSSKTGEIENPEWYDLESDNNRNNKESLYDTKHTDDPYDRPLDLDYHPGKTYQSVDHSLYADTNENSSNGKDERQEITIDLVDGHTPQNEYPCLGRYSEQLHPSEVTSEQMNASDRSSFQQNSQRMSVTSQEANCNMHPRTYYDHPSHFDGNMGNTNAYLPPQRQIMEQNVPLLRKECQYGNGSTNYHGSIYEGESYAQAKEKIYGRRRADVYNYVPQGAGGTGSRRGYSAPGGHQSVSSSNTMPNMSQLDNLYDGRAGEEHYFSGPDLQRASPNSNIYSISESGPTYLSTQTADLYSPTGHNNMTNPYRMTNTPLLQEETAYVQIQSNLLPSPCSVYEPNAQIMNARQSPSVGGDQDAIYMRGQPPPYHIAAPYTKQAHYFNGTG